MQHSIEGNQTGQQTDRGAEFTAVIYPSETSKSWRVVIERWVAYTYDGIMIYPQQQVYSERIPNTGIEGIVNHLESLGWSVPDPVKWTTVFHNPVQSAYAIELAEAPELPEDYRGRPLEQRWAISECMLRGISAEFAAEMIDSGQRTVEEIRATFETEKIMRTIV